MRQRISAGDIAFFVMMATMVLGWCLITARELARPDPKCAPLTRTSP